MIATEDRSIDFMLAGFTGKVEYRLTNAYMFVAVLQKNEDILCNFVAALLHIKREEIVSIEVLNPIILGEDIAQKDCVLDLLILLNNNTKINIEMQVENEGNWDDRGVYYLARNIADLKIGDDYHNLKRVIQIGILDFTFPKGNQEFYQENMLINKRTHRVYSDKMAINVLCLSQIENATQEDRDSGLYQWAKIFKATTWEELKKMSRKDDTVREIVVTMAKLTSDDKVREQCRRREKYERDRINAIHYGVKQGLEQGMQQGLEQGMQQGLEQGMQQGLEQGIQQGLEQGMQQGLEQGMQQGLEQGMQQGLEQGMQQGLEQGMQQGLEQGIQQGLEQGMQQGLEQGIQQGLEQGIQQGLEQGIQQGLEQGIRTVVNISREHGISKEEMVNTIMRDFSVSREEAEKYANS